MQRTSKSWLVAAVGAISLTAVTGTSAFALQDGGNGGDGGEAGRGGDFLDEVSARGGNSRIEAANSCDDNDATGPDGSSNSNTCRGFNASAGASRLSARTGAGGNGGNAGRGGPAGNRFARRSTGGGFPF